MSATLFSPVMHCFPGRVDPSVPRSKRLLTDDRSNVFIFMTGHGGNEFLKFQDNEEISAFDIADAVAQMWEKKRYVCMKDPYVALQAFTSTSSQVQRAILHDRHLPGQHDVFEVLLSKRSCHRLLGHPRELLFCTCIHMRRRLSS